MQRPSPWSSVCVSVALVSIVLSAGAAVLQLPLLPTLLAWFAGFNLLGAVTSTLLGVGGQQQLVLDGKRLQLGQEHVPREALLGVEVNGRDLILVHRKGSRLQTRQTLRFHHPPHQLAQLARYLRGWRADLSMQAGDPLPTVRRDASLLERLAPLGARANATGVQLAVQQRRVRDALWVLPVVLAAILAVLFEMPFLVILGLAALSFAAFASLWGRRGVLHLDDGGLRLANQERLAWTSLRGATVDAEGVVIHLTDGGTRKILLTLRKPLLAEVLTDLARPDEGELPQEARQLQQMRDAE